MARRRYLVAYDIRDGRRLGRARRLVKGYGWPMQLSVFICDLDVIELLALKAKIGTIIDHRVDSVTLVDGGIPAERGRRSFDFMGAAPRLPAGGPLIL